MLVKKVKRLKLQLSLQTIKKLKRLWTLCALFASATIILYILDSAGVLKLKDDPIMRNTLYAILLGPCILCYFVILKYSTFEPGKILFRFLHERRIVFILIILGIVFYMDTFYHGKFTTPGILFPLEICCFISLDLIVGYFPRKMSIVLLTLIMLLQVYLALRYTILETDCEVNKLPWGVYGETISHCTVYRLSYQTLLSLLVSGTVATYTGRTDNLFFCNANIYRSTGTIDRTSVNAHYVRAMSIEQSVSEGRISQIGVIRSSQIQQEEELSDDDDKKEDCFVAKGLRFVASAAVGV